MKIMNTKSYEKAKSNIEANWIIDTQKSILTCDNCLEYVKTAYARQGI